MSTKTPLDFVVLSDAARDFAIVEEIDGVVMELDVTPIYDHEGDSGMRLYVLEDIELKPFEKVVIPHGIAVSPPAGYETQIRPRSSAFAKKDCLVVLGTIDESFRGQIGTAVMYMPKPVRVHVPLSAAVPNNELFDPFTKLAPLEFLAFPAESMWLRKGDRITQLVLAKVETAEVTRKDSLPETSRGARGWGSTDALRTPA